MKWGCSLYEFRDDLAHSLQLLKGGEFSVCVCVGCWKAALCLDMQNKDLFCKGAEHLELSSGISLLIR